MSTTKSRGFTIVELLIVIVIIVILAAITVASYSGAQARARDSQRLTDASSIMKALELYKARTGTYPNEQAASWETSIDYPTNFINNLVTSNIIQRVPVDPTNSGAFYYRYYLYPAGSYGCDPARGDYYVLMVMKLESESSPAKSSPGFSCPTRNWQPEAWWVTGDFSY